MSRCVHLSLKELHVYLHHHLETGVLSSLLGNHCHTRLMDCPHRIQQQPPPQCSLLDARTPSQPLNMALSAYTEPTYSVHVIANWHNNRHAADADARNATTTFSKCLTGQIFSTVRVLSLGKAGSSKVNFSELLKAWCLSFCCPNNNVKALKGDSWYNNSNRSSRFNITNSLQLTGKVDSLSLIWVQLHQGQYKSLEASENASDQNSPRSREVSKSTQACSSTHDIKSHTYNTINPQL